jgi:hypothetical protein
MTMAAVLAGVFAMHALTSHHDPAIAGSVASDRAAAHAIERHVGHGGGVMVPAGDCCDGSGAATAAPAEHQLMPGALVPDMATCVAVLAGSLLALVLALIAQRGTGRRGRLVWRPPVAAVALSGGRPPPRPAPSLTELCILRT